MFCMPRLVLGDTECVGSRFHVLLSHTSFRRYRGPRVPFSCFARPDSFSAVPTASGPVFMYCAPGLVFGDTKGVGSRFHILRYRTRFRRFRGRQVQFSCFAFPDSFSAVPRASCPVFMFCAPEHVFGSVEGIVSRFRRYRGRRVPFSCFARPASFSEVPSASGPVFMFCTPRVIFGDTECVGSHFNFFRSRTCFWESFFHVLHAQTRIRRYRVYRVLFSCFALPD
jgi:hypothetical protein